MRVKIKETNEVMTLALVEPGTGIDYTSEFIGNTGALHDGQFTYNGDVYLVERETDEWWDKVLTDTQVLENRIEDLRNEHGYEDVQVVIADVGHVDLGDLATVINGALDEAFGREVV